MIPDAKASFLGIDLDTDPHLLPRDRYLDALNVTRDAVAAGNKDGALSNIVGNQLVSYTLPTGRNKVIGALGSPVRGTVVYFVWNENAKHSILEYDNTTRTIQKIFESKTDSGGTDILNFDENKKIHSANLLLSEDGDLLFFLDSLGRPTGLNLQKFKAGAYTPVTRAILDVAKDVPLSPPTAAYLNDTTRRSNSLRNRLFRFKTRFVYDDNFKTTCSPISKVPQPPNILDDAYTGLLTNNNAISVTFPTGDKSVKKVELLVSWVDKSNDWSDFQLVKTFDKVVEGLGNDTTTAYSFYNDSTYLPIPVEESIQLFDYLPDLAGAQELLNGDVLAYAALTEGLDRSLTPNVTLTVGTTAVGTTGSVGTLNANPTYSTGDVYYHARFDFVGTPATGTRIIVRARRRNDGLSQVIGDYTTAAGDTAATVITYLYGHITGPFVKQDGTGATWLRYALKREWWEPIDPDPNAPNISGKFATIEIIPPAAAGPTENNSTARWPWSRQRRIGLQYFDQKGKTNGVLYEAIVAFPAYAEDGSHIPLVPTLNVKIRHQPPLWAASYTFVVTRDATQSLYWHTLATESDNDFYYFDVSNFKLNAEKKPATASILQWDYQEGDRLRLLRRQSDQVVFDDTYEAALTGIVDDPKINGGDKKGRWLKFKKASPFTGIDLTTGYFVVELFRPAQVSPKDKNVAFFEIGEQYAILEPGTANRRHAGGVTNQSLDLTTTPAETNLTEGDAYFRVRNIYLSETGFGKFFVMDPNFVDFYPSAVSSCDGRPTAIDESATRRYRPTLIRFGQAYQQDTNLNGLNRFYPNNYDVYSLAFGDVMRLAVRNKYLYVFQQGKIGEVPLYNQITKDSSGSTIAVVTDKLLNPIQYYMGEFGIGTAPESLAQFNYAFYGVDNRRGVVWRLSQDGIQPISIQGKVNSWASKELPLRTGNSKVYGAFDQKSSRYLIATEAAGSSAAYTMVFSEKDNAFEGEISLRPEWMVTLGNLLIAFRDGKLYTHDSSSYNTFFGVSYPSSVTLVFNEAFLQKKTFQTVAVIGSGAWECPLVYTNTESYAGQRQESNLVSSDFETKEGVFHAGFLRDQHSIGGVADGNPLKGNFAVVKFQQQSATNFIDLQAVTVFSTPST